MSCRNICRLTTYKGVITQKAKIKKISLFKRNISDTLTRATEFRLHGASVARICMYRRFYHPLNIPAVILHTSCERRIISVVSTFLDHRDRAMEMATRTPSVRLEFCRGLQSSQGSPGRCPGAFLSARAPPHTSIRDTGVKHISSPITQTIHNALCLFPATERSDHPVDR